MMRESWLLALGFVGQAMFAGRFGVQWWASERQGRMIDHDSSGSMEKKKQEGYF